MYIVEGNIGAGKSTFLTLVAQYLPHIKIALEPVNNWQKNVYGQSLLANFYENPQRWSYTLETFAMICRVREHMQDQTDPLGDRLIERSIYSGHYCFVLTGYQNGFMNDIEWTLYNDWFNALIPQKCLPPRGFIYLRTTPEVAYQRIKKRNRIAEKNITFAYLKQIHNYHEKFLCAHEGILPELKNIPVLILDADQEFQNDSRRLQEHLEQLTDFIAKTSITPKNSIYTMNSL